MRLPGLLSQITCTGKHFPSNPFAREFLAIHESRLNYAKCISMSHLLPAECVSHLLLPSMEYFIKGFGGELKMPDMPDK
jgi:hypothetical protein